MIWLPHTRTTSIVVVLWYYSVSLCCCHWRCVSGASFLQQQQKQQQQQHKDSSTRKIPYGRLSATTPRATTLEENVQKVASLFSSSSEDVPARLVQLGVVYAKAQSSKIRDHDEGMQRVPGCIAHVQVKVVWSSSSGDSDGVTVVERVCGTSDAYVSRGLLSVVAELLTGLSEHEVAALDPDSLTQRVGLRDALSPGRNDGFANIVRTAQAQRRIGVAVTRNDKKVELDKARVEMNEFTVQSPEQVTTATAHKPRVALLLSGGVDSSVALHLLLQQGYNVTAYYLKIWLEDELSHLGTCPWEDDFKMCRTVCEQIGVPLESISLQEQYKAKVISHTIAEAKAGRTPNPDILCNSRIKFGCFYEAIDEYNFDYVATGHYASLQSFTAEENDTVQLMRAPDPVKDQSYFLCALTQEQLQRVLFPIGHLQKSQVRELAEEFQLPNRHRPDSQGLCFLGKVKFDSFLQAYLGDDPGPIVDAATGESLGIHRGVWYHTTGQRKGIGKVLDPLATSRGPWYVVAKDVKTRTVFCSNQYNSDFFERARSQFSVEHIHWIAGEAPDHLLVTDIVMKIRHGPNLVQGVLTLDNDDKGNGDVVLEKKDSGLAPGQYVAFYDGDRCLGGGIISERHWATFLMDHQQQIASQAV